MVSSSTIAAIIIALLIAIGTPIVLLVTFKKKFHIWIKVVLFGMLTFFFFVTVLEGLVHAYFLMGNKTTKALLENTWLYMLYGGLMAGLFEETGRFIMFAYVLKKYREWRDGLAFGLGHGGIEAILTLGTNSIMMLAMAFAINSGTFKEPPSGPAADAIAPLIDQLTNSPAFFPLLGGFERVAALTIHIGLSLLVLYGVRQGKKVYLLYAILLHAVLDFPAALYQKGMISIYVVEGYLLLLAIGFVVWIVKSRGLFASEQRG